jgi:hypothetical protein
VCSVSLYVSVGNLLSPKDVASKLGLLLSLTGAHQSDGLQRVIPSKMEENGLFTFYV